MWNRPQATCCVQCRTQQEVPRERCLQQIASMCPPHDNRQEQGFHRQTIKICLLGRFDQLVEGRDFHCTAWRVDTSTPDCPPSPEVLFGLWGCVRRVKLVRCQPGSATARQPGASESSLLALFQNVARKKTRGVASNRWPFY